MAYDRGGLKALKSKPSGGRQRENMSLAEERALLARFAKAAGAGEMLNIHDLKAAYEKAIGHETSNSTVYNLLARHGWRKLMPRPFHPKRDIAAQCGCRSNSPQKCRLKIPQLIVPPVPRAPWGRAANRPPNPALPRKRERCGGQAWGTRHDSGSSSAGVDGLGDRP